MAKGKKTRSTTEQTQQRDPWAPAADLLTGSTFPLLQQWGGSPMEYTGPSYIGPTGAQQGAMSGLAGYYGGAGESVVNPTMAAWQGSLDPMQSLTAPGAMNPLNLYAKQVGRALDENVRPGYARQQVAAGQTGGYSSERAQNERLAERNAAEAIADYGGNLFSDLYRQGQQLSMQAQANAPMMMQLGAAPYQGMYQTGGMDRAELQQQQQLQNAQRQFSQMEPYERARMLANILLPAAQLGGTAESTGVTTQKQSGDTFGMLANLGLAGAGLMSGNPLGPLSLGGGGAFNAGLGGSGWYTPPNLMAGPFAGTYGR